MPAIDTRFFSCTAVTNENGDTDYPYYRTSTTRAGYSATEVRGWAGGLHPLWQGPRLAGPKWVDVHGAGGQRSDPKTGPPFPYATTHAVAKGGATYTDYAFGPQADAILGLSFVRLARANR